MAKKIEKARYAGFSGEPCELCGWGPATTKKYRILESADVSFDRICTDCVACFESIVNSTVKLHGTLAFGPVMQRLQDEGFDITIIDD